MPNTHNTLGALFTAIADAIREHTGDTAPIVADNFPTAIAGIRTGMEFETGTWSPEANTNRGEIAFANEHEEAPVLIVLTDTTGTALSTSNSNMEWLYFDAYKLLGAGWPYSNAAFRYGLAQYSYRGTSPSALTNGAAMFEVNSNDTGDSGAAYPRYWATETAFYPATVGTSRYWRTGRTYKWVAIWRVIE